PGYGNSYFLPRLSRLWDFQAGYRYHAKSGTKLLGWHDDWLVIASEGGDPFIFLQDTEKILYAHHGIGLWEPNDLFNDLPLMVISPAILGVIKITARQDFNDPESNIKEQYQIEAKQRINSISQSLVETNKILSSLGWT